MNKSINNKSDIIKNFKPWILAARLRTLPLAASNIILGSLLAYNHGAWNTMVFIMGLLTALSLQVLSNFANDYGDFKSGADEKRNSTLERAIQSGQITPAKMKRVILVLSAITLISGISLIWMGSKNMGIIGIGCFVMIGLLCIVAAIKYTIGKNPYGYKGLGDVAVFLFFGIIGVCGIYYLHAHEINLGVVLPAASLGLLSTGVLNINNIRDIESDRQSGKNTLVVRWGLNKAKIYHAILVIVALALGVISTIIYYHGIIQYLYVMTIPFFVANIYKVHTSKSAAALDKELKYLAIVTFFYAVFYGI